VDPSPHTPEICPLHPIKLHCVLPSPNLQRACPFNCFLVCEGEMRRLVFWAASFCWLLDLRFSSQGVENGCQRGSRSNRAALDGSALLDSRSCCSVRILNLIEGNPLLSLDQLDKGAGFVPCLVVFHEWVGVRHNSSTHWKMNPVIFNDGGPDEDIEL
jgi:hypothetical protein